VHTHLANFLQVGLEFFKAVRAAGDHSDVVSFGGQLAGELLADAGAHATMMERNLYLGKNIPIGGTAHQAGTLRFGTDPATSVLDVNCKAHELDNLYVTDASFFPSIGAVNPTLTIIANALRVADHIGVRLGVTPLPA
jgi:choline dehydrogenase-like flavoprotein